MPYRKLTQLLEQNHVHYDVIPHDPAYTAAETAESAHVPGYELAKTVIVKVDGRLAMAVLPATDSVHPEALKRALGAGKVTIAGEKDFADRFEDCEIGAMPPFGELFGMDVYVTPRLALDEEICFNAGSHRELVRMPYRDFERLAHPVQISF